MIKLIKVLICIFPLLVLAAEPNPPTWNNNVKIFDPSDSAAFNQDILDAIYSEQGGQSTNGTIHGEWSENRYALLFKPGTHDLDVNVGFYTQVLGLGRLPGMTKLKNLKSEAATSKLFPGSLHNHWRGAENVWVKPTNGTMTWAVSQGSPLRRVTVQGNLNLFEQISKYSMASSSGGWLADSYIQGVVNSGSQQQWASRNNHIEKWQPQQQSWNNVMIGVENAPSSHCGKNGSPPYTTIDKTPVSAEKPYIALSMTDPTKFDLIIPATSFNTKGQSFHSDETTIPFDQVYVASNYTDTASTINAKLAEGLHLILQPGNYNLTESIKVTKQNQVVLGIGMATLNSGASETCIEVGNVDGVRISGIIFQAGKNNSDSLLQWGIKNQGPHLNDSYVGNPANPGVMHDIFARVGGYNNESEYEVSTTNMVVINSGNVIIDNIWLWRADHGINGNIKDQKNIVLFGLVVYGSNVIGYGISVEHTLSVMTKWYGENGQVWFYQSEFPNDVDQLEWGNQNISAYYVNSTVKTHSANGVGVYSYFRDYAVSTQNGFTVPDAPGVIFTNVFTLYLWGVDNGGTTIQNVINGVGGGLARGFHQSRYVCQYSNGKHSLEEQNEYESESFIQ